MNNQETVSQLFFRAVGKQLQSGDDEGLELAYSIGEKAVMDGLLPSTLSTIQRDVTEELIGQDNYPPKRVIEATHAVATEIMARFDALVVELHDRGSALQSLNKHYGRKVQSIVSEREEASLARETAEAQLKAKAQFLAMMSHEIRTPMNTIVGMTSLLLDTQLNYEQRDFVDTVRSSSDHLLNIINDILDYSKIEAGRLELEKVPFNLRNCIEETLDLVASKASEKMLELAYEIAPDTPIFIKGDSGRIRQNLLNYLSNAIKFTKTGEIIVLASASQQQDGCATITLQVRDTGIGIPQDRQKELFTAFKQVESSTTRHYGGTGLGLSIVKMLAERMGGGTWVSSEVGRGSTFGFSFLAPLVEPFGADILQHQPQLAGRRVLAVDDNATNRRILQHCLTSWGCVPLMADSAIQAQSIADSSAEAIDLLIIDHHLQDGNGIELARAIHSQQNYGNSPVLLLTSHENAQDVRRIFNQILTKPIKVAALRSKMLSILGDGEDMEETSVSGEKLAAIKLADENPLRILIADDVQLNQTLLKFMLAKFGYTADFAFNGEEAFQAIIRQPYDVVFMDMIMPEMNGIEATKHIRSRFPEEPRPRIIALTGGTAHDDREQCLAAGMDDYLSKPVSIEALETALRSCRRAEYDTSLHKASTLYGAASIGKPQKSSDKASVFCTQEIKAMVAGLRSAVDLANYEEAMRYCNDLLKLCRSQQNDKLLEAVTLLSTLDRDQFLQAAIVHAARIQKLLREMSV